MQKKIICCILAAAMMITDLPVTAMAAKNRVNQPGDVSGGISGDVNGDGGLDPKDISMMLKYIVEDEPSGFQSENADVNGDGKIDLKDLLMVKRRIEETLTVSFYDGDRLIETLYAEKDKPLKEVPTVAKSSKANAVLIGYFTDQACTVPFYAENPVTQNMKVYAKYQEMGGTEELNFTSFAQMDMSPEISFEIQCISGNIPPETAAVLTVKDGSDTVALEVTGPDANGNYTVKALHGFNEGCSYELTLAEGWVFKDKEETIRTAAFSIAMEEVKDLRMSEEIVYIQDTADIDYTVAGQEYEELTNDRITETGGTFGYSEADALQPGDIICIYVGTHPNERDPKEGSELLDPAVYVKVTAVNGNQVSFGPLQEEDQIKLYDVPDNFPIMVAQIGSTEEDYTSDEENTSQSGETESEASSEVGETGSETLSQTEETGSEASSEAGETGSEASSEAGETGSEVLPQTEETGNEVLPQTETDSEDTPDDPEQPDGEDILAVVPDFTADTGEVNINALDLDMYSRMMGEEEGTYENALKKINVGDFITLYTSSDEITSEKSLYYAQITTYDEDSGTITYRRTTKQAILDSMDLYQKITVEGDDLVTDEEKKELEEKLLAQVEQSDFAEEAAYILSDMITKTDGFRENMGVKDFLLTDENGNPLSDEEIALLNLGASFELSDDIELKVELVTKGDQLHFRDGGVQLAIGVKAEFEVEVEDGKVAIDLSANFVQEVALDPRVRGGIVTKEILFIPVPIGVEVNAAIDIRNYTAFSFMAEIYTVAEEDKSVWEKMQAICNDPTELLGLEGLPDGLKNGLKTAGDVMDKIDEVKAKINQTAGLEEEAGYKETLEKLWEVVEENKITTKEEWEQMGEDLDKTSIVSDLLGLMDMTTETDISTEYLDSMQALMDKYSEVVQKETDWVQLVNEEIFSQEYHYYALAIGVEANFIVRADMSIAIGSNLEYEVGKRYNFWFKIGLFKPTAGSSSMDLLDEKFAFQFYVMGKLGLKAGVRAKLYVGLGSGKFASVGIAAELGPYIKLYGFFVYENTKFRPANSQNWIKTERMAGALYLEFGLYFMLGFEANALGNLFEYSYDFLDEEIPLLTAGESRYYYDTAYKPEEDEVLILRDEDGNSTNGITMTVPDSAIALSYVDLDSGIQGSEKVDYGKYNFTVSNPNFKIDPKTGLISVDVPENTRYMECDLTVTYLYGKLAFSQYDMTVTVPLVWTNLSTDELKEFYTASVRVGNDRDGYQTVWSKRVLKNQQYDLPTDAEIKEMIGWSDAKYTGGAGYGSQKTTGLTLIQDMTYDYNVEYKTYSVTVNGIQNADGSTRSAVYTAKYGESFDFSDLVESGIEIAGQNYTKFAGVKTDATITAGGGQQEIDLKQDISERVAEALDRGITANALYVDDSVAAIFEFTGIAHDALTQRIRKGTTPSLAECEAVAFDNGVAIKDVLPDFGNISAATVYHVICGELEGPEATIIFEENGGSDVPNITKVVGSLVGNLPTTVRTGYSFGGWYTDNGTFRNRFEERKMQEGGAVLYAKWTPNEYTVTFHVNGGNSLNEEESSKTVVYDSAYGTLPVPTKTGYAFTGWYTAADGGIEITADTTAAMTAGQILYAHWRLLKTISPDVFDFGSRESGVYSKGMTHEVYYGFNPGGESFSKDDFTFKYMRQGNSEYETGLPINAGTYNVTVSRPADDYYNKFEYTYNAVITVDKAVRTLGAVQVEAEDKGYTFLKLKLAGDGGIDDLSSEATFTYQAKAGNTVISRSADRDSYVYDLMPATAYSITVKVTDDPNYEDAESSVGVSAETLTAPMDTWQHAGRYDTSWYNEEDSEFRINSAEQLVGLVRLVQYGYNFKEKTIILTADVDLRGYAWESIGNRERTFEGTFDGKNHKITGLYMNERSRSRVGLFGYIKNANIQNILLDHSYICGKNFVGGIVGYAQDASTINNCVNYAHVIDVSTDSDDACAGGIVGFSASAATHIVNCVNYGSVKGSGNHIGGIVGHLHTGEIWNCANYGAVTGASAVGGITGQIYRKTGKAYNNFTVGTIKGSGKYVGACIGRIDGNDGDADQCYYLAGSATCNGAGRNAVGTEKGSLKDGDKGFNNASFTSPTSGLSRVCESQGSGSLINDMNHWANRCKDTGAVQWDANGPGGYPLPVGSPLPDAYLTR